MIFLGLCQNAWSIKRSDLVNYASSLRGKKKAELKTAIYNACQPTKVLEYGSGENKTWSGFYKTDRIASTNECINRYSESKYYFTQTNQTSSISGMNIEHSFPKSWWGGSENKAYKDLFNLYPSDEGSNSTKSNYPMGKVTKANNPSAYELVGTGPAGKNGTIKLFEPNNTWKGDFCRTYFYMATIYQNLTWQGEQGLQQLERNTWPTLQEWAYTLYLEWTRDDVVVDVEVTRNNAVAEIQGNRNLFIDFPYLAEYVWGDSIDVEFDPTYSVTTAYDDDRYITRPYNLSAPEFSLEEGTYDSEQTVTITCPTAGVSIYYTIDGSTPTTSSLLYSDPITLSSTTTLKAISAIYGETSGVRTATYTIVIPVVEDDKFYYAKANSIESGKSYLIVADNNGKLEAASPVAANKQYSYLQKKDVTAVNGVITLDSKGYEFTFIASGNGHTIKQSDGRYLYQKDNYDNFNVNSSIPSSGAVWTVVSNADGTFKITNATKNKYIQYNTQYGSYGSYSTETGIQPSLYVRKEILKGDINGDDTVSIQDVTLLVDILRGKATDQFNRADVNNDGEVTNKDVETLIELIFEKP